MELVECVPNFSEGRRPEVIDRLVAAITEGQGVKVIDTQKDADHNRCVITFVALPDAAREAAFRAARLAAELIDMRTHQGAHPRMGATDVIPFIPLGAVPMSQCVELARALGKEMGEKLAIPVYLYAEASLRPERYLLPDVRKGEYEGIRDEIGRLPSRDPDFGPAKMNLQAGATAVGARQPLIAYNINLSIADVAIAMKAVERSARPGGEMSPRDAGLLVAKRIAKKVRASNGGLPFVQAMGLAVTGRDLVQVSMNLTNFRATSVSRVYDRVAALAARCGLVVAESEFVGCVPRAALGGLSPQAYKAWGFQDSQILESHLDGA